MQRNSDYLFVVLRYRFDATFNQIQGNKEKVFTIADIDVLICSALCDNLRFGYITCNDVV